LKDALVKTDGNAVAAEAKEMKTALSAVKWTLWMCIWFG
jgi:hypothetical protein